MVLGDGLYKKILDNMHEGVRIVDPSCRSVLYWNRGAEIITGYRQTEVCIPEDRLKLFSHCGDAAAGSCAGCPVTETAIAGKPLEREMQIRHKNGHFVPVLSCFAPVMDKHGVISGVIEIFSDMTWKNLALQKIENLRNLALFDSLTGVWNRRYGEMAIAEKFEELRRYGRSFGLLFIDLDDFKSYNDMYGHPAGDELLRNAARSITMCLRIFDTVCRWGGDEFVCIVSNIDHAYQMKGLCGRISGTMEALGQSGGVGPVPTMSIGAVVAKTDDTIDSILLRADQNMYRGKTSGKNRFFVE